MDRLSSMVAYVKAVDTGSLAAAAGGLGITPQWSPETSTIWRHGWARTC